MTKFGLGRGLADLRAEMGNVPELSVLSGGERVVVRSLPLDQIVPNPNQPRKNFSPDELHDLANSIKEKGVLQPILVRATLRQGSGWQAGDHKDRYEIVAGERRFRAAKLAGMTEIPALVKSMSDENSMEIALIENIQRENLNPIEEAAAFKNLIDTCGYGVPDVVRLIGKSDSYVRNALRILALPISVKEMVERGELSAAHARTIVVAADPVAMAKQIISGKMSVDAAHKMVKSAPRSKSSHAFHSYAISKDEAAKYEKQISKSLGTTVALRLRKGGAGDIMIRFNNKIHMEELIKKLTAK
ncbi:MAG: ParB/RepB/Spo0J family partition protein [Proteobacteria bacterium]|nr:ParB/RepB/Spo0J family partition protein [Pseudomonadota bacterium]